MNGPVAFRLILAVALLLPACAPPRTAPEPVPYRLRSLPPEPKEILAALFAISQTPLSASSTCAGVGTEPDDATIGQYLSGFLAELSNPEAGNAITTTAIREDSESAGSVWICRVMIRHSSGEDIWSWGVEFPVSASDGAVLAESVRCVGAG